MTFLNVTGPKRLVSVFYYGRRNVKFLSLHIRTIPGQKKLDINLELSSQ